MVGRIELLTAEREQRAQRAVADLASADPAVREQAFGYLRDQGRYVEPIIRRIQRTSRDERTRLLCRRLLQADFVTEIRSAIHGAADGARIVDRPAHVRAQLAILLKELGYGAAAKAEGEQALADLRGQPAPALDDSDSRGYLRACARATEATGDTRAAWEWYGKFITFGAQIATNGKCRFCHADAGPRDMAWYQDWWAGKKYAALATDLGIVDQTITEQSAIVKNDPDAITARMLLAYLHVAKGQSKVAERYWAEVKARDRSESVALRSSK
jgi:hypothetical protein